MQNIRIVLNGQAETVQPGQTIGTIFANCLPESRYVPFIAVKNNAFASLNEVIQEAAQISSLQYFYESSRRAYENAAIATLNFAADLQHPGAELLIMHSMCDGIFCRFSNAPLNNQDVFLQLGEVFRSLVSKDYPILPVLTSRLDAINYFRDVGRPDTAELLKYGTSGYLTLYTMNGKRYWLPSPPAPRTGLLNVVEIKPYDDGFVMRCPTEGDHTRLHPFRDQLRLYEIFQESERWGEILGVQYVAHLNRMIAENQIADIIKVAEALHEKKIASIADEIDQQHKQLVFVAGPSSSGKTTFSKRLAIQLRVLGYRVVLLSLDNYFLDRDELQRRQGADLNFEVLEAIDLNLLNEQLNRLLQGETVTPPVYDFHKGVKNPGTQAITADPHTVFILEGIHGINPDLTSGISDACKYKVYVSALTHLNFDQSNRIPTHDTRLIRRIVRDAKYRGYSAADTIGMWKKVVEGEKRYIFTYQGSADVMFNTSLLYEIGVLKVAAVPALKLVPEEHPSFPEAQRLLDMLAYFLPLDEDEIPPTSILREFIGKSSFTY